MSAERTCGGCAACCHVPPVPEVAKPHCTDCRHLRPAPAGRCGVYDQRPGRCAAYRCLWLRMDDLPAQWRPDVLGLILDLQGTPSGRRVWRAMEARPGAIATDPEAWEAVHTLANVGSGQAVAVILYGDETPEYVVRAGGVVVHRSQRGRRDA